MKTKHLLLLLLSVGLYPLFAQDYGYGEHKNNGASLNYRILFPENFNRSHTYPIILFLHGAGERGNDNEKQLVHGSDLFLSPDVRNEFPSIVIFPQCPEEDYWSNAEVDRSSYPIRLKFNGEASPTTAMTLVIAMMDSVTQLEYVDKSKIYVGGLSMGGMGTYEILARRPEMFSGAFAICGGGDTRMVDKYAKNTPIWVFHGAKDNVVAPFRSTEMVLALQKAGSDVRYTLYPKDNHNSWDSAFDEKDLLPWLFSQQKK